LFTSFMIVTSLILLTSFVLFVLPKPFAQKSKRRKANIYVVNNGVANYRPQGK